MDELKQSFKTRVCHAAIQFAASYYEYYIQYDYMIFSDAFISNSFYIISAEKTNYLHLIGVSTRLSALDFFDKCYAATLTEDDFEIAFHGNDNRKFKGTIRRKINALSFIDGLMNVGNMVEEGFHKNAVTCSLASSDGNCTMGFIAVGAARPMTLLIGNELNSKKSAPIKLVLRRPRGTKLFGTVYAGRIEDIMLYYTVIQDMLSDKLKCEIAEQIICD